METQQVDTSLSGDYGNRVVLSPGSKLRKTDLSPGNQRLNKSKTAFIYFFMSTSRHEIWTEAINQRQAWLKQLIKKCRMVKKD